MFTSLSRSILYLLPYYHVRTFLQITDRRHSVIYRRTSKYKIHPYLLFKLSFPDFSLYSQGTSVEPKNEYDCFQKNVKPLPKLLQKALCKYQRKLN